MSHTDPNFYLVRVYFLVQHKDEKDRKVHLLYFDVSAQDIDIESEKKINLYVCTSAIFLKDINGTDNTNTKKVCLIMPKVMSGEYSF